MRRVMRTGTKLLNKFIQFLKMRGKQQKRSHFVSYFNSREIR